MQLDTMFTDDDRDIHYFLTVKFDVSKGYKGDRIDPPEPPIVDVQSVALDHFDILVAGTWFTHPVHGIDFQKALGYRLSQNKHIKDYIDAECLEAAQQTLKEVKF